VRRGQVYWCRFAPPDKTRPVVVLTRDSAIGYLGSITVAPITTTVRRSPSQVVLDESDGMRTLCAVKLYGITSVPKARVGKYMASLSPAKLTELQAAIAFALGLDDLLAERQNAAPL